MREELPLQPKPGECHGRGKRQRIALASVKKRAVVQRSGNVDDSELHLDRD